VAAGLPVVPTADAADGGIYGTCCCRYGNTDATPVLDDGVWLCCPARGDAGGGGVALEDEYKDGCEGGGVPVVVSVTLHPPPAAGAVTALTPPALACCLMKADLS
jgi:hypothetical protein